MVAAGRQPGVPTQRLHMLAMQASVAAAPALVARPSTPLQPALAHQLMRAWDHHHVPQLGVVSMPLHLHRLQQHEATMHLHLPPQRRLLERVDMMMTPTPLLTLVRLLLELDLATYPKMPQHRGLPRLRIQNQSRTTDLLNHWMLLHQVVREQRALRRHTVVVLMHLLRAQVDRGTWRTMMTIDCELMVK